MASLSSKRILFLTMEKINMSLQGIFSEEKSYRCQKKIERRERGGGKREQENTQARFFSQCSVGLDCFPADFTGTTPGPWCKSCPETFSHRSDTRHLLLNTWFSMCAQNLSCLHFATLDWSCSSLPLLQGRQHSPCRQHQLDPGAEWWCSTHGWSFLAVPFLHQ